MNQYKACSKCKQVKLLSEFHKSKAAKSGHKPACKECKHLDNKTYRSNYPDKVREIKKAWNLKNLEKIKAYRENKRDYYYSVVYDREKAKIYYEKNKEKLRARSRTWRANNHAKARELERNYRLANPHVGRLQNHRRKALKYKNGVYQITSKECQKILAKPCFYCGDKASHLDHVIPLALGGRHSIGNLAPSCVKCNTSKHKKTIMEWRVWKAKVLR